jgi:hypothetical protein
MPYPARRRYVPSPFMDFICQRNSMATVTARLSYLITPRRHGRGKGEIARDPSCGLRDEGAVFRLIPPESAWNDPGAAPAKQVFMAMSLFPNSQARQAESLGMVENDSPIVKVLAIRRPRVPWSSLHPRPPLQDSRNRRRSAIRRRFKGRFDSLCFPLTVWIS